MDPDFRCAALKDAPEGALRLEADEANCSLVFPEPSLIASAEARGDLLPMALSHGEELPEACVASSSV